MNTSLLTNFTSGFASARSARVFRLLLVLYVVLTLCGYVVVSADVLPVRLSWVASLILFLAATVVFLSESRMRSAATNAVLLAAIVFFSFGLEYAGMRYGVPFGAYEYTGRLGISFAGVPLAIPAAWYTTLLTSWRIAQRVAHSPVHIAITAGVLTVALDLVLEPMASSVATYWIWHTETVPVQNYVTWFLVATIAAWLLQRAEPAAPYEHGVYTTGVLVFALQAGLFVVTDLVAGFVAEVLVATFLVAGCLVVQRKLISHSKTSVLL